MSIYGALVYATAVSPDHYTAAAVFAADLYSQWRNKH